MEFLILAILGLTTAGMTKAFSSSEEEDTKESKDKKDSKDNKGGKDAKDAKGKDDKDKEEEPKKTPRQKLMEAIAEYESQVHEGERVKIHLEIEDR